jgi:hypothetical protein
MLPEGFFLPWRNSRGGPRPSYYRGFVITLRHTTLGRTPVDECPTQRPLPDNTNTHKGQTSMPLEGFEPTISVSEGPQTRALDLAATGIGAEGLCH